MSADISQSPVPTLTEEAWLLHDLRLRGFRPAKGGPAEEELTNAGMVMVRGPNLALAPPGREAHAGWAQRPARRRRWPRPPTSGSSSSTSSSSRICTDWQLKPGNQPNDHSDAAYDFKILERLDRLDERAGP